MYPNDLQLQALASSPSTNRHAKHPKRGPIELIFYTPATTELERKSKKMSNPRKALAVPNEFWICCCSYTPGQQLSVQVQVQVPILNFIFSQSMGDLKVEGKSTKRNPTGRDDEVTIYVLTTREIMMLIDGLFAEVVRNDEQPR
ncbi:hypothetical protein IFR05_009982 [Cadophora sp. M221]|nr:hypothetical protein IFR05_009982 [Cadophora sp. M221]